jgi:hypothetical protein
MNRRPKGNSANEQLIKYQAHKRANIALTHFIAQGNYIAAYVIAFSIFEDKVKAFYIVRIRDIDGNQDWQSSKFSGSTRRHLEYLLETNAINKSLFKNATKATEKRNVYLHAAMYNVDFFTMELVTKVVELRNEFARLLQAEKRALSKA